MNLIKKAFVLSILILQVSAIGAQTTPIAFSWTKFPHSIHVLDSLISKSGAYGLNKNEYSGLPKSMIGDSVKLNSLIDQIAIHFFSDLAIGTKPSSIFYHGVQFKIDKQAVIIQVYQFARAGKLADLVNVYNNQSKEITILINELKKLQDSTPRPNKAIQIISKAINDYKWLHAIEKNNKIILVNLPSTKLSVLENGNQVMQMKLIVGKPATPSGTFTAVVNQVVINPYWNVPKSIMVREMLPSIQNDIAYFERNHLELRDVDYKKLDPSTINWYDVDTVNFPFFIRQSTGCDNSLGIIKLDFDNPYGIYLHDTPQKELFALNNRFFSHGCMRMEKPIEMAKYLLKNNPRALDSIDFENCYKNPQPINIQMTEKVNVIVWYHLVDFDEKLKLQYYPNIYHKPLN